MAVMSTFDRWRKDVFFSAAEEVQESADTYVKFSVSVGFCDSSFNFDGFFFG